jgi:hypothetical protein
MLFILFKAIILSSDPSDKKKVEFLYPRCAEGIQGTLDFKEEQTSDHVLRLEYSIEAVLTNRYRGTRVESSISFFAEVTNRTEDNIALPSPLACKIASKSGEFRFVQKARIDTDTDTITFFA